MVIVKLTGDPTHPFNVGVTEMVLVIGVEPPLVPTKVAMFPVPLAPSPIPVFEFVHVNVAPAGVLENVPGETLPPHCEIGVMAFTIGLGLTVIVKVVAGPTQPLNVGTTEIVLVIGALVALAAVKVGKLPEPLAPSPMAVLLLVHVNVAPAGVLLKAVAGTAAPGQCVWLGIGFTVGAVTVTGELADRTQLALPKLVVAVKVKVVVPFGNPLAVVFTVFGAAIETAGLEVH